LPRASAFAGAAVGEKTPLSAVAPVKTGAQRRLPEAPAFTGATVERRLTGQAYPQMPFSARQSSGDKA